MKPVPIANHSRPHTIEWSFFLFCWVCSSLWCVTASREIGVTFDEPLYLQAGMRYLETGNYRAILRKGPMPLPVVVQSAGVRLGRRLSPEPPQPVAPVAASQLHARYASLIFWSALLFYGWYSARRLAGPWAGCLALALLACEPSFLGHAALATTDIAASAGVLAFVYHFTQGRGRRWAQRVLIPALCLALATLAKGSALIFCSLAMIAVQLQQREASEAEPARRYWSWDRIRQSFRSLRRDAFQIPGVGLLLVFLFCGTDWQAEPDFVGWAQSLPTGLARDTMIWTAEHLRIFTNAGNGLVRQIRQNIQGQHVFLLGLTADRALWYYFPVLLTIKLSTGLLLLSVAVALARRRLFWNPFSASAGILLLCSFGFRLQIGVRLVLPVVALWIVGVSIALIQPKQAMQAVRQKFGWGLACFLCLSWTAVSTLRAWPDGIRYVNELWGGTEQGYLLVSDSNYDWGQGLPDLERWREEHADKPLGVWYFGTDPAIDALPMKQFKLHQIPFAGESEARALIRGQYLAVSASLLYGAILPPSHQAWSEFFRRQRPVARTRTFIIYDLIHLSGLEMLPNRPVLPSAFAGTSNPSPLQSWIGQRFFQTSQHEAMIPGQIGGGEPELHPEGRKWGHAAVAWRERGREMDERRACGRAFALKQSPRREGKATSKQGKNRPLA